METEEELGELSKNEVGPHSLGTLIEWKPLRHCPVLRLQSCPHSLGTLIEWKLYRPRHGCTAGMVRGKSPLAGDIN